MHGVQLAGGPPAASRLEGLPRPGMLQLVATVHGQFLEDFRCRIKCQWPVNSTFATWMVDSFGVVKHWMLPGLAPEEANGWDWWC
jgi:hypothetical protein